MTRDKSTGLKVTGIGIWSTDYRETTGQAIVTRRVATCVLPELGSHQRYIFPATGRPSAIGLWAFSLLRLWIDAALRRVSALYVVCSRSNFGLIRDLPALLLARCGIRVVVHAHGSDIVDLLRNRRISPLARWAYARCDVIVPSAHLLDSLNRVVKSATVCEGFFAGGTNVERNVSRTHGKLTVLWNSNVMASKGFFDLATAVGHANESGVEIDLVCLGVPLEDSEMPLAEVSSKLVALQNSSWLEYLGRVDHSVAIDVLGSADVVALPSRYPSECQPIAVVDAMCSGSALLVSDLPALQATVGDYPAEVVPAHSVQAIQDALQRLSAEKKADPVKFVRRRSGPATEARKRFATSRFDENIMSALSAALTA